MITKVISLKMHKANKIRPIIDAINKLRMKSFNIIKGDKTVKEMSVIKSYKDLAKKEYDKYISTRDVKYLDNFAEILTEYYEKQSSSSIIKCRYSLEGFLYKIYKEFVDK